MPIPMPAAKVLDREFLGIRCRLIELAAAMDRIDRAGDAVANDPRWSQIRRSIEILIADASNRAERVQAQFSLPYEEGLGIGD
jgi:hypothetical protein